MDLIKAKREEISKALASISEDSVAETLIEVSESDLQKAVAEGKLMIFSSESIARYSSDLRKALGSGKISPDDFEKGRKDMSKLVKVVKTDKNGKKMTVWVKRGEEPTQERKPAQQEQPSGEKKEAPEMSEDHKALLEKKQGLFKRVNEALKNEKDPDNHAALLHHKQRLEREVGQLGGEKKEESTDADRQVEKEEKRKDIYAKEAKKHLEESAKKSVSSAAEKANELSEKAKQASEKANKSNSLEDHIAASGAHEDAMYKHGDAKNDAKVEHHDAEMSKHEDAIRELRKKKEESKKDVASSDANDSLKSPSTIKKEKRQERIASTAKDAANKSKPTGSSRNSIQTGKKREYNLSDKDKAKLHVNEPAKAAAVKSSKDDHKADMKRAAKEGDAPGYHAAKDKYEAAKTDARLDKWEAKNKKVKQLKADLDHSDHKVGLRAAKELHRMARLDEMNARSSRNSSPAQIDHLKEETSKAGKIVEEKKKAVDEAKAAKASSKNALKSDKPEDHAKASKEHTKLGKEALKRGDVDTAAKHAAVAVLHRNISDEAGDKKEAPSASSTSSPKYDSHTTSKEEGEAVISRQKNLIANPKSPEGVKRRAQHIIDVESKKHGIGGHSDAAFESAERSKEKMFNQSDASKKDAYDIVKLRGNRLLPSEKRAIERLSKQAKDQPKQDEKKDAPKSAPAEKKEEPKKDKSKSTRQISISLEQAQRKAAETPMSADITARKHGGDLSTIPYSTGWKPSEEDKKHLDNMDHVNLQGGHSRYIDMYIADGEKDDKGYATRKPFLASHGGKTYHVDPQGYNYARHITPLKGYSHPESQNKDKPVGKKEEPKK